MIELKNITYTYPFQKKPAVKDISLKIDKGEVLLVTGASGCGKSTLVRLANGLCPHFFKGELKGDIKIDSLSTLEENLYEISRKVGTVFQDPELQFFALRVDDELAFVHELQGKKKKEIEEIIEKTARQLGISHILDSSIHDLSEGQKQKVAIGVILSMGPSIVVLDEPSANLDPESTEDLALLIKDLKDQGIAILIADHRLYWLKDIVDKVIVMEDGEMAIEGDFSVLNDQNIRNKFGLRGHKVVDVRETLPQCPVKGAFEVRDLSFSYKNNTPLYEGASFCLEKKITGIIGDNGTGKTTLARILTGLTKLDKGKIFICGEEIKPGQIMKRASIVLQNTDHQLYMNSVLQEVMIASGVKKKNKEEIEKLLGFLEKFGLRDLAERHPQSLSGGEKQRLVIACALAKKPEILILDEPTSGLDGHNMVKIAEIMQSATDEGVSVVVITHDLELLGLVCSSAIRLPFK
ncbi:MAG: ABC transporter [Deltaproteobacteria bacterium]|nr:MAG: ABC transporter [Deltaproteobacteria bacterium]PIE74911.1 MAG: ABC transporter [Deltaproteobacteria bacterium]